MGDQEISPLTSQAKRNYLRHLLDDVQALETMISEGMIETGATRIGAEQEFCLVKNDLRPSMDGPDILQSVGNSHFTSELAKWNLEINLAPQDVGPGCFSRMENQLEQLLLLARQKASEFDNHVIMTGILPTIRKSELNFTNMTPNPRYQVLDNILKQLRGEQFMLNIEGVDELSVKTDSICYEACNTSFQVHIQIEPEEFVDRYNWAQVIAGPVLSCCVNSPLLLGQELWMETRIALFRQSLDIRHAGSYVRDKQPRVSFGREFLERSVVEAYRDNISNYRLLLSAEIQESSLDTLKQGRIPELRAMNLHNGTVFKWNRVCFGIGGGVPHLRIENRYLPSGPTSHDEMANTVFWVGLMLGMPDKYRGAWNRLMDFRTVRHNFLKAAQHGLSNEFEWFGKTLTASHLIVEELIPLAFEGLKKHNLPRKEFKDYLTTIHNRVIKKQTGADWIVNSMRKLRRKNSVDEAMLMITRQMNEYGLENVPGHQWELPKRKSLKKIPGRYDRVDSVMSTGVILVRDDDLVVFAESVMKWHHFKRLPVENDRGQICGMLTARDLAHESIDLVKNQPVLVREVMTDDVLTIAPESSLKKAEAVMRANDIGAMPVIRDDRVIGIITVGDILRAHKNQ